MIRKLILAAGLTTMAMIYSCQSETTPSKKDDAIEINNPYTAQGVDTSLSSKLGHLSFTDTVHDFGTIREGEIVVWDLEATNTGKSDLVIYSAHASCGCTVPDYPREAIKPNTTVPLSISFDSKEKSGPVEKQVTIETNGFPKIYYIKIKANVIK